MAVDKSMGVMVVDDYKTMLRILHHLMRQLDFHNVEEASDGDMALKMLRRSKFGLIISDWNMSPMSGLDLLRAVRTDPKLMRIPFVMITAESKAENVVQAREAGVSTYIVKPFNLETLKAHLVGILGDF